MPCRWQRVASEVENKLPTSTSLVTWKASLYESRQYGDDFRSFQKLGGDAEEPLQCEKLPSLPELGNEGIQSMDDTRSKSWKHLLEKADADLLSPQVRQLALLVTP